MERVGVSVVKGLGVEGVREDAAALEIAAMKSNAENGLDDGPVSRSFVEFRIKILYRIVGFAMASPTPLRIRDGTMDVYNEPME